MMNKKIMVFLIGLRGWSILLRPLFYLKQTIIDMGDSYNKDQEKAYDFALVNSNGDTIAEVCGLEDACDVLDAIMTKPGISRKSYIKNAEKLTLGVRGTDWEYILVRKVYDPKE